MFVSPMLLHKSEIPIDSDRHISELKLDGIRLVYSNLGGKVRLHTRHDNDVKNRFPELLNTGILNNTILDGELIYTNHEGKPAFETLMKRFMMTQGLKINHVAQNRPVSFCAFDIIKYKNKNVTRLPLLERKKLLNDAIKEENQMISKVRWVKE